MRRFWFGYVQSEIGIISYRLISLLVLITCFVNLMNEGSNDVKYIEKTFILYLTKGRMKNRIDLLLKYLTTHLAIFIAALEHQTLRLKLMLFSPLSHSLIQNHSNDIDTECKKTIHSADLVFRGLLSTFIPRTLDFKDFFSGPWGPRNSPGHLLRYDVE